VAEQCRSPGLIVRAVDQDSANAIDSNRGAGSRRLLTEIPVGNGDHAAARDGGRVELTERGAVRVIRSPARIWVWGVIACLSGIFGLAEFGYLVIAKPSTWTENLSAFAFLSAIAVAFGVTEVRPRLVVSNAGVHVVNPLRTTFVAWRDVLAVGPTRRLWPSLRPSLQILRKDGGWVAAVAVQRPRIDPLSGRQPFVDRVAQQLEYLAERHRLHNAEPAPQTARAGEGPLLISAAVYATCVISLVVAGMTTS